MGLLIPGFTLSWTVAKEVNRPEHSGMATSVVNLGIFLGTGILQPLVGAALDRGRANGDAWRRVGPALWILVAERRGVRALASFCARERTVRPASDDRFAPPSIGTIAPVT